MYQCGVDKQSLPSNEAYLVPEANRGLLRRGEGPVVCKKHYEFLVGMNPGAEDLVGVAGTR